MELTWAMARLAEGAQSISTLCAGMTDDQFRWKPDPESWSVLEVICHLRDEERQDFPLRLKHILDGAAGSWPPIDPGGWVTARRYNAQDPETALADFLAERQASLAWLAELAAHADSPNWETDYAAPWGPMRAGDMLASWVAHDLLHMRQLVALRYAVAVQESAPYDVRYAGDW